QAIDPNSPDPEFGPTAANVVDHVLAKSCGSCHLDRYGTGDAPGLHRSSGCSACHSTYDEDGLSKSNDPWVDKTTPSHPVTHALAKSPHTTQCAACHHYSEAIGLNYQGLRRAGSDEPDTRVTLGRPLYGLDADGHITDENSDNQYDETPPDVHFSAGMHCADCHTAGDAHGPENPTLRGSCAVTVRCEDCHGSVRERASEISHLPRLQVNNDAVSLRLAIGGKSLEVPQIVDAVNPESPAHNPLAERVMGIRADGRSHTDDIACQTCHAAWLPSQYGQFATLDLRVEQTADTTGILTPGGVTLSDGPVATNDLILGIDGEGRLRPTIPSGRWFFTLISEDQENSETATRLFEQQPLIRTSTMGQTAAFTQRPVDPHTTTLRSGFAACNRCHTQGDPDTPLNGVLLDVTFGAGSNRFNTTGCDVERGIEITELPCDGTNLKTYRLDALFTPEGDQRAIFEWGSPVSSDAITRMKGVVLAEDAPILLPIPATDDDRAYPPFIPE
ncbi:MAG: hypothetical protein VX223_03805, partial [Myxococcota bacterium]|nr:hypothetical protein [Myxococcota bacterium]